MIPNISWLHAGGSILLLFHINLHCEAEGSLKVDKKSTSAERLNLELLQSCFSTHISHPAHSTLLCSQGLLRGRKEKLLEQFFSLDTAEWILLVSMKHLDISKTPELVTQLQLSLSSWEPRTDNWCK